MNKFLIFICVITFYNHLLSQSQLDVQGESGQYNSPVVNIKANCCFGQNPIGLKVDAVTPTNVLLSDYKGVAGYFRGGSYGINAESTRSTAIYASGYTGGIYATAFAGSAGHFKAGSASTGIVITTGNGVIGESSFGAGVFGWSTSLSYAGIVGGNINGRGVDGYSQNNYAFYGRSANHDGAYFEGGSGKASIILGQVGTDKGIIQATTGKSSDLIIKSNDFVRIELDDNNNSTGNFDVLNGTDEKIFDLNESGNLTIKGALTEGSDINRKTNIQKVNNSDILKALMRMPIYKWAYVDDVTMHIGPMAQDFHEVFQLGQNETSISTIDRDGVALSSIQELYTLILKQQEELDNLKKELIQLQNEHAQDKR